MITGVPSNVSASSVKAYLAAQKPISDSADLRPLDTRLPSCLAEEPSARPARSVGAPARQMLSPQKLLKISGRWTEHVQPALNRPVQSAIEANMFVSVFVTLGNSCHSPLLSSKA